MTIILQRNFKFTQTNFKNLCEECESGKEMEREGERERESERTTEGLCCSSAAFTCAGGPYYVVCALQ